jgi:hypothetical protein
MEANKKRRLGGLVLAGMWGYLAATFAVGGYHAQAENTIILVKSSWLNPTQAYCVALGFFILTAFCVVFAFRDRD